MEIKIDRYTYPSYDADWVKLLVLRSTLVSLNISGTAIDFQRQNAAERLNNLCVEITPSDRDYSVMLKHLDDGQISERVVATIRGLRSAATVFSFSGRPLREGKTLVRDSFYYLLAKGSLPNNRVIRGIPVRCVPRPYPSRQGWVLVRFSIPAKIDSQVRQFVQSLGHRVK